jgi:hypothetical protein
MVPVNNENIPKTFYGVFNKHTKVLYAFELDKVIADAYDPKNFLIKKIELKPFEYYFGDYETGQIYHENIKPLIREDELERKLYQEIAHEFTFLEQVCILVEILDKNEDLIKTERFKELTKFLKNKKVRYDQGLKAMRENKEFFNFLTKKEIRELDLKRIQGIT